MRGWGSHGVLLIALAACGGRAGSVQTGPVKPAELAGRCDGINGDSVRTVVEETRKVSPIDTPPALIRAGAVRSPMTGPRRGRVVAAFVVDSTGHADPCTIGWVAVSDSVFLPYARRQLSSSVYRPAMSGGTAVPAVVEHVMNWARQ